MKNIPKLIILLLFISIQLYSQEDSLSIYFESAKSNVSYNQQVKLERFITNLDEDKYNGFKMYGYADYIGDAEYNLDLSEKRLNEVRNFLNSRGITDEMIIDNIAKGELSEKLNNQVGNSESRRVDVVYAQIESIEEVAIDESIVDTTPKDLSDIDNVEVGSVLVLDNLNFYPGTSKVLRKSEYVLAKLLGIMRDNNNMKIEIQGHICCRPTYFKHDNLALERAKIIYDFLIRSGIDRYRLSYVDFGASRKLVDPERTETDMIRNRRVEIRIIAK